MNFKEVTEILKNNKNTYASILFGSRAKGTAKKNSDYDIAVFIKNNNKAAIKEIEKLKTEKFDIIPYSKLPLQVKAQMFKYGKPLFIKDNEKYTSELYFTIRDYKDNLHHYNILKKYRC